MQRAFVRHHVPLLTGRHDNSLLGIHRLNLFGQSLVLDNGAVQLALQRVIFRPDSRRLLQRPRDLEAKPAAADTEKQAAEKNRVRSVLFLSAWRRGCTCLFYCFVLPINKSRASAG